MAQLTRDDILKLGRLARLDLSEAEIAEYIVELTEILQYVELLQSVDVTGLEPTHQVTGLINVSRSDEIVDYGYEVSDLLKAVPVVDNDHIKVKRMVG
jgi:aspartyl-tRNA(Asn)/glutamyl-tRNA(Gln) amidotransferase subunit C